MKKLTKIEQLDQQFPGLADDVRMWFWQGFPVLRVVDLLRERYHVSVPKSTVGNFRARRWVRERESRLRQLVTRQAATEVTRELEMKDCPEAPTASLQAKVRVLFYPETGGHQQRALAKLIRSIGARGLRNKTRK